MKVVVFVVGVFFSFCANAEIIYERSIEGDSFVYIPSGAPENILVVAHGTLSLEGAASDTARNYLNRWIRYAEEYGLVIIVPVFDTQRFGNLGGGYGGYRNLLGRHMPADQFVNNLVDKYSERTSTKNNKFYLYGHSAGGQFVSRYIVTHPRRVIRAVISAAGRYSYPTKSAAWPYGAGSLDKTVTWNDGYSTNVSAKKFLSDYALAASRVTIVVGENDVSPQPSRPAHEGETRIDLAKSWAREMNRNAENYGARGIVEVKVIPGISHNSADLTPHCASVLFGDINA